MMRTWFDPWLLVGVFFFVLVMVAVAHVLYPRRDFFPGPDGRGLIMCDKWTGRCQRVEWTAAGKLQLMDVYTAP